MTTFTPEQIAQEITNPILGAYPDFTDDVRPDVQKAIALGIEYDREQLTPEQNRTLSLLNVYAPTLIEKFKEQNRLNAQRAAASRDAWEM